MPAYCAAYGCCSKNYPGCGVKFYRFPRDPERRQKWASALRREGFVVTDHSRICSKHFVTGMCAFCGNFGTSADLGSVPGYA